jgi:TRAP-type uncharacterized transport system substrate-binding protein
LAMESPRRGMIERHLMARHKIRTLLSTSNAARQAASVDTIEQDFEHRIRVMLRHRWLVVICAVLLLVGISAAAYHFLSRPTAFRIAVGPPGSDDLRLIQFLGEKFSKDKASVRLRLLVTENSMQAAEALDTGRADLAVVRADLAFPKKGQVVAVLRKNYAVLFAPGEPLNTPVADKSAAPDKTTAADKSKKATPAKTAKPEKVEKAEKNEKAEQIEPIERIEQLTGKRIGVVGRSQANIELLKVILGQYEIPFDGVQIVNLPAGDVAEAVRAQRPDAILAVGPLSSKITTDAIAALAAITPNKKPPNFLPIGSSEAIAERNPAYESSEIPKGSLGGSPSRPTEDVETVMVSHYIVASNAAAESTIGDLARLLLSSRQTLSSELVGFAKIEKPDTDKDANVAVHPGAKAFYDDQLKSFFEKYSDHLFWLFLIVPLLGSGLAGIASYMKAGERTHHLRLLNKLLDAGRRARRVETLQALERLQYEVDELVIQTVHRAERHALGESPQLSFVLAIEQVRAALADRRAILSAREA